MGEARRIYEREASVMFGPVQAVHRVEERAIDAVPVRVYTPGADASRPTLVYFHGGGWVVGSLDSHDGVARHLCHFGNCVVISAAYRLAPEHRFPAAVEDAWTVTEWATSRHDRVFVGGDSAGGNLAAIVAQKARDSGRGVDFQLLVYPVVDCAATMRSAAYSYWVDQYVDRFDATRGDASPLRATDFRELPPALILSCEGDPLVPQAEEYTRRLGDAGVKVRHQVFTGLIHGAYRMPGVIPGARAMLEVSAAALLTA